MSAILPNDQNTPIIMQDSQAATDSIESSAMTQVDTALVIKNLKNIQSTGKVIHRSAILIGAGVGGVIGGACGGPLGILIGIIVGLIAGAMFPVPIIYLSEKAGVLPQNSFDAIYEPESLPADLRNELM